MKSFFQARWLPLLLGTLLAVITFAAYFGVWNNNFVELDDQNYVFQNRWIMGGLKWSTVQWAFTHFHAQNWHPLTWLSHALDVQIYGLNAGGHHVTNLLFHLANTVLVFVVLRRMTGSMWRSALVAALFGVHPLHVESVAWVSERKDVLSGFFFLLTLLAYNRYVTQRSTQKTIGLSDNRTIGQGDKETGGPSDDKSSTLEVRRSPSSPPQSHSPIVPWSYCLALAFFALGLMSKPMLVTVPFVLLLLDWWPLGRFEATGKKFTEALLVLAREKIPFFVLTAVSAIITMQAQQSAMASVQQYPLSYRFSNAIRSCWTYIQQTFWPENLTVFYPHSEVTSAQVQTAGVALILITLAVLRFKRNARFLPTGWFWYLGMLVPVIGLVQVGSQAHADRYTYLPHIGLFIIVAWVLGALARSIGALRFIIGPSMAGLVVMLAVLCNQQVKVWASSLTLFGHGAKVNPKDYLARSILARNDMEAGRVDKAIRDLEQILKEAPKYPLSEFLLAQALQRQGKMEEAIPHLANIVAPDFLAARNARLVLSFLHTGNMAEAQDALAPLLQIQPVDPAVLLMQAAIFRQAGRTEEAIQLFRNSITQGTPPPADNPTLGFEIAELYALIGETKQAALYYEKALEMCPTHPNALNNYAWLLATSTSAELRDGKKAVQMAEKACELSRWKVPIMVGTLAAAYAEAGRFEDAVKTGEKARDLARAQGMEDVAKRNEELLALYRDKKPYRE